MAAKKKTAKKKKKTAKKARSARQIFDDNLKSIQKQLPAGAARRVGELRKTVKNVERQADKARADAEKRLHKAETEIRKDALKVLRRIERAIEGPKKKRKTKKKTAAKK